MTRAAEAWPAQMDRNGTIWYRPADDGGQGWTSDPAQADRSYRGALVLCMVCRLPASDRSHLDVCPKLKSDRPWIVVDVDQVLNPAPTPPFTLFD